MPLHSARPTVTFSVSEHHCTWLLPVYNCLVNRGTSLWTTCQCNWVTAKWMGIKWRPRDCRYRPWDNAESFWLTRPNLTHLSNTVTQVKVHNFSPLHKNNNSNNNTHLMALCLWLTGWAYARKVKPIWIYWSKRQWVAVASAGPYAYPHLAPDR